MKETNINFTGLSLTPYSDISPDGQLSACIGLESHGGSLRPSVLGGTIYTLPDDGNDYLLVHIHTTSAYSHFILSAGEGKICWANVAEGVLSVSQIGTFSGFTSVNSVGNTLVILTPEGINYALWKEGTYSYIGHTPPEINISFGLEVTMFERMSDSGTVTIIPEGEYSDNTHTNKLVIANEDNQREYVTDIVWGAINRVMEACAESNRFCMPFFVRAAYRRFDGSYTMLTPPVLMIPDSIGPKALMTFETKDVKKITGKVYGRAWAALLEAIIPSSFPDLVSDWQDIISSIDIFVSPQVMRADSSELITSMYGYSTSGDPTDYPPVSYYIGRSGLASVYTRQNFDWYLSSMTTKYFKLHYKGEEPFLQDLNGNVQFYKVRSIALGQLAGLARGNFFPVLEKSVDSSNLVQQESLPDSADYQSHDILTASRSHVYNQRLHLFGLERTLFAGFKPENAWAYTNDGSGSDVTVSVYVSAEDGTTRIVKTSSSGFRPSQLGRFLYYPDINANRMLITGGGFSYDIPLQPHPLLNGACYIFMDTDPATASTTEPAESNLPVSMANKVYASEVGNPYYFPLEGIYTIGSGKIYGLSSIATALSQGQFGQFPLMIFCSDGNYAMSVNDEGRYSAIHPMQRDVCVNPDAIVQTDSEVLFISSRGVMVTSGAGANCLSQELDGVPEQLPPDFEPWIQPQGLPSEFFRTCRIAYDYAGRRIVFFPSSGAGCYVFSIQDGRWSSAAWGSILASVNVFPYSYIQADGHTIYMLTQPYSFQGEAKQGLICTRPVKMDTLQLKRIVSLSLQGIFSAEQKISVYISNDCCTWHHIGTSESFRIPSMSGRPAKYWKFVIQTNLSPSENISALRIQYEPRKERRFR